MSVAILHDFSWQRMINAVEAVDRRQAHCVETLQSNGIAYAIVGGRAAMAWVDSVEPSASRTAPNVDVLVERTYLNRIIEAICHDGWTHQMINGRNTFAESSNASFRSCVRLLFANESVRPSDLLPAPNLNESCWLNDVRVVDLEALIRMKLTAFRTIDRVHLDDLLSVQLFDPSWANRFPLEFASRLAQVFDAHEVWPDVYVEALAAAGLQSDQELVEFQTFCRQSGDQQLDTLPWFLARENAHEKVRVA